MFQEIIDKIEGRGGLEFDRSHQIRHSHIVAVPGSANDTARMFTSWHNMTISKQSHKGSSDGIKVSSFDRWYYRTATLQRYCPPLAQNAARLVGAVLGLDDLSGLLSGVTLRLLAVDEVKTLGLDDAVDEGTSEAGAEQTVSTGARARERKHVQELLRLSVACGLAVGRNVLLVSLSSLWRRR